MTIGATDRAAGFTQLAAWQKAYGLVKSVYEVTDSYPTDERFGLVQQLRRAAVSVPSNIAESWGRGSTADYLRFVEMARGSLFEIQTQLWLSRDLGYIGVQHGIFDQVDEVQRLLIGLINGLRRKLSA